MRIARHVLLAATVIWVAGAASADASTITITPTTGLTFTLENLGLSSTQYTADGGAPDTYDINVTLTLNGTFVDSSYLLRGFGVDAGGATSVDFAGLTSTTAPGTWLVNTNVGVNGSSQCAGADPGTVCVEETTSADPNLVLSGSGSYEWLFRVDLTGAFASATFLQVGVVGGNNLSDKDQYSGTGGSLAFASTPPDPSAVAEPGSLMLLGSGLVFAANRFRRRKSA